MNENLENNNFDKVTGTQPAPNIQPKEPKHYKRWILGILIIFLVVGGSFRLGYVSGSKGYTVDAKKFLVVNKADAPQKVDYDLLWQALKIVQDKYIDKENIDQTKVLYGAIHGAISAAGDQYTEFFDPESYAGFKRDLQGSFSGIGAEITAVDGNIQVVAPLDGSPAQQSGIRAKDYILKIDDVSTGGMTSADAAEKIRGPEGTQVKLNIIREGLTAPIDITITRAKIEIKSVKLEYKEYQGKYIAVVSILRFGDDTKDLFNSAVQDIVKKNPAGIVLDLRNDPGGYLETSVDVASKWLEKGKLIVSEEHSSGENITYNSSGDNRLGNIKTVILVNGGSASASEILAGALKDNGKAVLIGEKTFGKGSVQELVPLGTDMAVKVTIAKWITPSGKNLNKNGLDPDIKVLLTSADIDAKKDPQMDTALQEVVK